MGYDRDDVLARIDLGQLCDELLGPHKGRGRSASWPCPDLHHGPQTGQTPPVTVFRPRNDIERWHCHGCGAGGTAIDLVMRTEGVRFPEALELLGRRAGAPEAAAPWTPSPIRPRAEPPSSLPLPDPSPALEAYVSACEDWLWGPNGRVMRRYLANRGLDDAVLRANRVGADPGPRALPRDAGLPRGGPAVVFPLLDGQGRAIYLQARYLSPNGRKYDNPSGSIVPASPRLGEVRLAHPGPGDPGRADDVILVCEGLPDALPAAQAGYRSAAVLGAGLPDERLARHLVERYPTEPLVLAFDADHRGQRGAERLGEFLARAGAAERVVELHVPAEFGDLNGWVRAVGAERFRDDLAAAVPRTDRNLATGVAEHRGTHVAYGPTSIVPQPPSSEPDKPGPANHELDELLETLAYQHFLVDDRTTALRNIETVTESLADWRAGQGRPTSSASRYDAGGLDDLLDRIGYHHVLVDDKEVARTNLDRVAGVVERCSGLPAADATSRSPDDLEVLLTRMAQPATLDGPALGL
jgi:hypothetical protein